MRSSLLGEELLTRLWRTILSVPFLSSKLLRLAQPGTSTPSCSNSTRFLSKASQFHSRLIVSGVAHYFWRSLISPSNFCPEPLHFLVTSTYLRAFIVLHAVRVPSSYELNVTIYDEKVFMRPQQGCSLNFLVDNWFSLYRPHGRRCVPKRTRPEYRQLVMAFHHDIRLIKLVLLL